MRKVKRALGLNFNYFLRRRTPTLVYSMERTGSVAMLNSLKTHGLFAIGSHYLDPEKLGTRRFSGSARWACRHIIRKRKPAKVITLVRSPIENMLSTFARIDYGEQQTPSSGIEDQAEPISPEQLSDDFRRSYLETNRYLLPLGWFKNEYYPSLGIDVYKHFFDREKGFGRIREQPYDALILRTEMPDEQKAEIVADFLEIPAFEMTRPAAASENRGSLPSGKPGDKTYYAAKYKALKQSIVIPKTYLESIVDSPHVKHFFTQQEREAMRAKYSRVRTAG